MLQFENHGLKAGIWTGMLTAAQAPARVALVHLGEIVALANLSAAEGEGLWQVTVELPASFLSDGAHSLILIADGGQEAEAPQPDAVQLDRLHLMAGAPLEHELVAEIKLMRAELDLLKREFRRLATFE
ncbi:hypothetical protein Q0601_12260 [Paracoccus onubensis]|uniref:hypothetical protein n=1 Tax=Paracoccus onubensis TaxID=1675788 RepID=UPI00272F7CA3|nr:hypothetical protein [Paracoccus onubensis]MDP0927950.1 hypothetical protein [Paracoccus onubensis]